MKRRTFMAGLGAAAASNTLSAPAITQTARSRTLRYIPPGGLLILDPTYTTVLPTVYNGHHVFDMLYAVDSRFQAKPQMAEGHTVSSDNLTWDIKLRPGLVFHDGTRVLARDCVASIKRWAVRDAFGASLMRVTDELSAVDDNTLRFRLKSRFGILPDALAHPLASPCFIMPERLAVTDINRQITEMVGSGPLRFVADEFRAGERAVYARNDAYVPRQEKPDGMTGGKVMHFDRVEWVTIAEDATAAAALQAGEVDWWDTVQFDLVPKLRQDKNLTVTTSDAGCKEYLRFNCGIPPFNNPALRRAVAAAVSMPEFTQAMVGSLSGQPDLCYAMYPCGLPGVEEMGKSLLGDKKDWNALAAEVRKAGYAGERIVIMTVSDVSYLAATGPVVADMLTKLGMNVDLQPIDLASQAARRRSQEPVDKGGWSAYVFFTQTPTMANPAVAIVARGLGINGYPGNYSDDVLETEIARWTEAATDQERLVQMDKIQRRLWDMVPIVPLTTFGLDTAFRSDLTSYLPFTVPMPWNIRRA